jgi:hypothetical protein
MTNMRMLKNAVCYVVVYAGCVALAILGLIWIALEPIERKRYPYARRNH